MCLTIFEIMHLKMQIRANMDRQFKLVARITNGSSRGKHTTELDGLDSLIKNQVQRLKEIEAPLLN
jgi:hypothetical protein